MASRSKRAGVAAETVAIVAAGVYDAPSGRQVSIKRAVGAALDGSRLYTPDEAAGLNDAIADKLAERAFETTIEVRNETTFASARRLVEQFGPGRVAALNFASAKNPGGGFLGGSQAQEESLARASALYACLQQHFTYYEANRAEPSLLYTDHLIVAPRVPVFRDDEDLLLEEPWEVTLLTSPAPNRGAIKPHDRETLRQVEPAFRRRIEQVLSAAVHHDQTALVLGAWGCGVFRNDPRTVAELFAEQLDSGGRFARAFEHVSFAVLDRGGETLSAFEQVLGR